MDDVDKLVVVGGCIGVVVVGGRVASGFTANTKANENCLEYFLVQNGAW